MIYSNEENGPSYIRVNRPFSQARIFEFLRRIEESEYKTIDKKTMGVLVNLVYHCALKEKEALALKIKNVRDKDGQVKVEIKLEGRSVPIQASMQPVLNEYFEYLGEKGYGQKDPLFPGRKSLGRPVEPYHSRKLQRDIRMVDKNFPRYLNVIDKIRQTRICEFYEAEAASGKSPAQCLRSTAQFAGISERHAIGILTDRITNRVRGIGYTYAR